MVQAKSSSAQKGTYDIGSNQHEKKGKYKVKGLAKGQTAKSSKPKNPLDPSFDKSEPNYDTVEQGKYGVQYLKDLGNVRLLHRTDGPAFKYDNGMEGWFVDGKRHRTDGPAIIRTDGTKEYWINNEHQYTEYTDRPIPQTSEPNYDSVEYEDNETIYYLNGQYHRTDGPAIEDFDGGEQWYQHGKIHREDGPASTDIDGNKTWFLDGEIHKHEATDGTKVWYKPGFHDWYGAERMNGIARLELPNGKVYKDGDLGQLYIQYKKNRAMKRRAAAKYGINNDATRK
jgi:hypothetical protein